MAKELSKDYTSYIVNNNLSDEINPILATTENIQTRINEIDTVFLPTIKHDTEITKNNLSQMLEFKLEFDRICDQIDNLENMVGIVKNNLDEVQKQVDIAAEELDIPEKKIDIILKSINIFVKYREGQNESNWNNEGFYEAPKIFSTSDFFKQDYSKH